MTKSLNIAIRRHGREIPRHVQERNNCRYYLQLGSLKITQCPELCTLQVIINLDKNVLVILFYVTYPVVFFGRNALSVINFSDKYKPWNGFASDVRFSMNCAFINSKRSIPFIEAENGGVRKLWHLCMGTRENIINSM